MRALSPLSFFTAHLFVLFSAFVYRVHASTADKTQWITYTNNDGETLYLDDNREPSLYTRDYGDCQGDSVIDVTRFDAAYYKDNMTITFHLAGSTAVANESVMMYIGVYAYGENRFNLTFDPCYANIRSMCPINASVPIEASGIIPIAPVDVAGIPEVALGIPDFEGQAILRIFGNSTQSQIACYSAVLTNGNTFSHPTAVGVTVGIFVLLAFVASVATAVYGQDLQETRKHYAHSLSIFVVFSILQHVFFTGALSMNFPSVLVAFWSNFGWASGMIYSTPMQNAIDQFVGSQRANISALGSAASGEAAVNLGGGYSLSSIYRRALEPMHKRNLVDSSSGFNWYGTQVEQGLPLPGNFSSFAGTLAELHIPASNAFLTGLIWFLVLLALMSGAVVGLKLFLELCATIRLVKTENLRFFRRHWIYCMGIVLLRSCYIAVFMLTFLCMFQLTIKGAPGVLAIASIVLCLVLIGVLGLSIYAVWSRLVGQQFCNEPDALYLKKTRSSRHIPWYGWTRRTSLQDQENSHAPTLTIPWRHVYFKDPLERPHVHDDEDYLIRFGWLSARFRRSKWWFFAVWPVYELVRACFYGAAASSPLTQVFGLLVWEILSLFAIVIMRPFESNRLNTLMVYFLGFSKVVSVALCSAFDPRFGLGRILTTVVGIIIIVVQGILIICMMVAVVIGCISSWMSIRRYKEDFHPTNLVHRRTRYFAHVEQKATDRPPAKPEPLQLSPVSEEPKEPYFSVTTVRRQTKIEDENLENENEHENEENLEEDDITLTADTTKHVSNRPQSRSASVRSRNSTSNLPYGARRHRASWSTRDFSNQGNEIDHIPSGLNSRVSVESVRDGEGPPLRKRASSVRHSWTNDPSLVDVANAALEHPSNSYRARHVKSKSMSQTHLQKKYLEEEEQDEERPATRAN